MQAVVSDRASNLTDGRWDATLGSADDILPEVPPDGGSWVLGGCEDGALGQLACLGPSRTDRDKHTARLCSTC